jgi:hypothetical protein
VGPGAVCGWIWSRFSPVPSFCVLRGFAGLAGRNVSADRCHSEGARAAPALPRHHPATEESSRPRQVIRVPAGPCRPNVFPFSASRREAPSIKSKSRLSRGMGCSCRGDFLRSASRRGASSITPETCRRGWLAFLRREHPREPPIARDARGVTEESGTDPARSARSRFAGSTGENSARAGSVHSCDQILRSAPSRHGMDPDGASLRMTARAGNANRASAAGDRRRRDASGRRVRGCFPGARG